MAICTACGAASGLGSRRCASCGQLFAEPVAASSIGEVVEVSADEGVDSPPPSGSWGSGTPYDPGADRIPAVQWLLSAEWLPPLKALIAPTAVLLLAALLVAVPGQVMPDRVPFGTRFGAALSLVLTAFHAPLRTFPSGTLEGLSYDTELRVLPMTVTVLWLLTLWLGLRTALRTRWRRTGAQLTGRQAVDAALRTALPAALTVLLLGLSVGATSGSRSPDAASGGGSSNLGLIGPEETVTVGWGQAALWALLAAGLLALAVYGTDVLRWAAWQRAGLRGWLVSGLISGRVAAVSVGAASLVTLIVTLVPEGGPPVGVVTLALPNLGLVLLGFASGATAEAGQTGSHDPEAGRQFSISLFDLHGQSGQFRWALLLAIAAAVLLGRAAHRRGFEPLDRLKLAVVNAALLSLLMLGAGIESTFTVHTDRDGSTSQLNGLLGGAPPSTHSSAALTVGSVLLANVLWSAVGALAVPAVLDAVRRRQPVVPPMPSEPPMPTAAPGIPPQAPPSYAGEVLDSHGGE